MRDDGRQDYLEITTSLLREGPNELRVALDFEN